MEHELSTYNGPLSVESMFRFGMHHRKTPAQITALITNAKTDDDDPYLLAEVPAVSTETWIAVRDRILADQWHVDYVTYDQRAIPLQKAIMNSLDILGETREDIAESLQRAGIKGECGAACWCPVAIYLRQLFQTDAVNVDHYQVSVNGAYLETPRPVALFVGAMDDMRYPGLRVNKDARRSYLPAGG